jgi:uncharacterized protein YkwD
MSPQLITDLAPVSLSPMALRIFKMLPALLAAISIAGCGGGGDAPSAVAPTPAPTPVAAPAPTTTVAPPTAAPVSTASSSIVTSVPAPTYAPASKELAVYSFLNDARSNCGFGKLAQSTALDTSLRNHAQAILLTNNYSHAEVPGTQGFTGVDPAARAAAAGYNGYVGETTSPYDGADPSRVLPATTAIKGLMGVPYHMLALIRGNLDLGIGAVDQIAVAQTGWYQGYLVVAPALRTGDRGQAPAAGTVRTYPCEGTTDVVASTPGESPNPLPGRNYLTTPWGPTIAVMGDLGTTLVLTSASLVNVSTGATVAMRIPVTKANDPNPVYLSSNEGYVLVDVPLAKGTRYQASISGTSNGAAFNRNFTFTTQAN